MLKTLLNTSSKYININQQTLTRNYARKNLRKKLANPGIQKQINILDERDEKSLENLDIEELEADFMRLGDVHDQHKKELHQYRDKEKYWIVKRKYFKENQCNFLTWNDKEQIRYLHEADPSEWSVEKLSEGFPALPETINKILKNKWHKNDNKREQHDKSVENNWKLFKEGKIQVPEDLARHLGKFSIRKPNFKDFKENRKVNLVSNIEKPKPGEFSSIIQSYEKLKNIKLDEVNEDAVEQKVLEEIEEKNLYGNKMVPLSYILKKTETIKTEPEKTSINLGKIFHGTPNKYLIKTETKKQLIVQEYPEKISIPKDKYKKGSTYKVNDCYYDDDGLFLYRVPGMY